MHAQLQRTALAGRSAITGERESRQRMALGRVKILPVTHMNVMEVYENFDLDHPQDVQLPIFDLCNQLIHHYLLAVLPNGAQRFDEVWVFSDYKRNVCLYDFDLGRMLEVFSLLASEESAGYNDGTHMMR